MSTIASNIGTDLSVKDGVMTVNRFQDCDPIAERCKEMAQTNMTGTSEFKFAGSIPDVMVEKYCNDKGITHSEFMQNKVHIKAIMNDPAMAHFRVWKGKL